MGRVGYEEVVKLKVRWKTIKQLSRLILSFHVPVFCRGKNEGRGRSKEVLGVGCTRVRLGLPKTGGIETTTATTTIMSVYRRGRPVHLYRLLFEGSLRYIRFGIYIYQICFSFSFFLIIDCIWQRLSGKIFGKIEST